MSNLFPIPTEEIITLKQLTQSDAREWLSLAHPHLTETDVNALLRLARPNQDDVPAPTYPIPATRAYVVDPKRNRFILASNYAGASQYQLAHLFGVTRQTIYSIIRIHKERDDALRQTKYRWNPLQVAAMRDWYYSQPNIADIPLAQIISQLITAADACTGDPLD